MKATNALTRPAIVCGRWYKDNWITAYVRAVFPRPQAGPEGLRLHAVFHVPRILGRRPMLVVRLGPRFLATTPPLPMGQFVPWSVPLPPLPEDDEELTVSLRADASFLPGGVDGRHLGVVLIEWRIVPADGA